jgi:hypothetical protein
MVGHGNKDPLARIAQSYYAGTNRWDLNALSYRIAGVIEHVLRDNRQGAQGCVRPSHSSPLQLNEDQQPADGMERPLSGL